MKIDVEENLIAPSGRTTSIQIDNQIEDLLDTDESQNIRSDIELLKEMGFDKKMINKVYILLRPANIQNAIDFMTEIDDKYQHNFMQSAKPEEKDLCFICKKPRENHMDYNQNEIPIDKEIIIKFLENLIKERENNNEEEEQNDVEYECEVCYEKISAEDKGFNKIKCGHFFCKICWFNYLKNSIMEGKVDKIKCMNHGCNEILSKEFILKHISEHEILVEKYNKFLKRDEILNDKNKKLCPNPDCDSFLEKSEISKYVKCENGHEFCFECLKPPHGNKKCDNGLEKNFLKFAKGHQLKRCPRCQIYTEKNKGCNHMTCVNCQYQWCWLCEGEYKYGHYDRGNCKGQQFLEFKDLNAFGLHKLFPCICPKIIIPFVTDINCNCKLWGIFIISILFMWLFGMLLINAFFIKYIETKFKNPLWVCNLGYLPLFYFCAFQIPFTFLTTPFVLICIIYPKFLGRYMYFFGIGDDLENE